MIALLRLGDTVVIQTLQFLALSFAYASAVSGAIADESKRPNVLLLLVDDLKPSFGAYGDDFVHSPNLDRLFERGLRCDKAYCNQAVCAPSRNNLLVGSRSTSTGIYSLGYHFRRALPNAVTLPQHFMNHGYHAAGVGKVFHIGHGNINDKKSWSVPFQTDKVIDYVLPESTGGQLTKEQALFSNQPKDGLPRGAAWERADVDDEAYADGRIASEGIRRLENYAEGEQPFFLALGFCKPHLPFCAPEKYWRLYDDVGLPEATLDSLPKDAPAIAGKGKSAEITQFKPLPLQKPIPTPMAKTLVHGYYSALSYMDAQLGRVVDAVDRLGLADNTIIVLWGDHGYHLGDHGLWTKHTNYEQANRIPILFVAPGVTQPGTSTDELVETVDIYPTLASLAGLPTPNGPQPIDGDDLTPVLLDPNASVSDHAYHCFPRGKHIGRAIRTDKYRLVEWSPWKGKGPTMVELYDYENDAAETRNLAKSKPKIVTELRAILSTHPAAKPRR